MVSADLKKEKHPYAENVEKFEGETIEVKNIFGDLIRGKCIAINKTYLNLVMEIEGQIVIIKNAQEIRRTK